jgi:hypothetical protein
MENGNRMGDRGMGMTDGRESLGKKSVFLMVVGGLLVLWAAETMLSAAGLWSKTATEYAGGAVLGLLGAIVLYRALGR